MNLRALDIMLFLLYAAASVAGLIIIKSFLPAAQAAWRAGTYAAGPVRMVAVGASLYIVSFLVWLIILSRNELSIAYPLAIGLTLVFLSVMAKMVLHEPIGTVRIVGIFVIFLGVVLVSRSR